MPRYLLGAVALACFSMLGPAAAGGADAPPQGYQSDATLAAS